MSGKTPSKYQLAIYDAYENTKMNIFVSAGPGSGKSYTIQQLVKKTPFYVKAILTAFNKSIAEELKSKVPHGIDVSTIHSLGFKILRKNVFGRFKVNEIKSYILAKKIIENRFKKVKNSQKRYNIYLFTIAKLYDLYRLNLAEKTEDSLRKLSIEYNVELIGLGGHIFEDTIKVIDYITNYNNHSKGEIMIDFTDMIWITYTQVDPEMFPKYGVVFIDECLPYYMPVLLADGGSLPIGEIVENNIDCKVLTYNEKTGNQEPKKIIGKNKSFNNKKMYKIKGYNKSNHNIRSFVVCTYNHKIYVKDKGFIYAENIKPGMVIQYETSAKKTQKYKITKKGREVLSETMVIKNNNPEIRKKVNENFNKRGYNLKGKYSTHRGGNGKINELQLIFLNDIKKIVDDSENWDMEVAITTGMDNVVKYKTPKHYKIDICNKSKKIAIELDGNSHKGERLLWDKKKDDFLKREGWIVKRIKNNDLIKKYDEILNYIRNGDYSFCYDNVNCIVDLIVDSIDEIETKDTWVYDIEVEDNHNFYANGILVHNCQDLNPLQREMILKLVNKGGRFVAVGDERQAIYSFMGSNLDSFNILKSLPNTKVLPLSVSYRCGKNIVNYANEIFEGMEAFEDNPEGIIRYGDFKDIQEGDMVLCRNNLPLIESFLELLNLGKKSYIMGRDFGKSLTNLVNQVDSVEELEEMLHKKYKGLVAKGIKNPHTHKSYINLLEKVDIIKILIYRKGFDLYEVSDLFNNLFKDEPNGEDSVTLSTIHKSKGLENERVIWLYPELLPSAYAKTELEIYQEQCLKYVVITRAIKELIIIRQV